MCIHEFPLKFFIYFCRSPMCIPGWPQTYGDSPASTSHPLEWQAFIGMPRSTTFFKPYKLTFLEDKTELSQLLENISLFSSPFCRSWGGGGSGGLEGRPLHSLVSILWTADPQHQPQGPFLTGCVIPQTSAKASLSEFLKRIWLTSGMAEVGRRTQGKGGEDSKGSRALSLP